MISGIRGTPLGLNRISQDLGGFCRGSARSRAVRGGIATGVPQEFARRGGNLQGNRKIPEGSGRPCEISRNSGTCFMIFGSRAISLRSDRISQDSGVCC